jgi:hypothetical protein
MDTIERVSRIEQRIAELDAGKEIDAKHTQWLSNCKVVDLVKLV